MCYRIIIFLYSLCSLVYVARCIDLSFPPKFKFGAATSSYQIEGGWDENGKGENVWDRHVHNHPEYIKDFQTGDIAADSYHSWREDVKIAAEMGLQFYRFSINWPRILPNGFPNKINKVGVNYYSEMIDALLAEGIEPVITLYHWELPVNIQDMGGWTNPLIVKWFGDYARIVFSLYADRVKTWLTINEPILICDVICGSGYLVPGLKEIEFAPYLCNKHILLAHATAYRIFNKEFKTKYSGRISLANQLVWIEPATPNDTALAELGRQHLAGRYCHPIFSKEGGWPPSIEKAMLDYSLKKGYSESTLPSFTKEEIDFIKGTGDFIAMNYYTTYMIRPAKPDEKIGNWFVEGSRELNAVIQHPLNSYYGVADILPVLASTHRIFIPVYPKGIRSLMKWLKEQYGNVEIFITENGFSTAGNQLDDYDRIDYIKEHLEQILLSIKMDNVNVIGYTLWSMIDTFEWPAGYTMKFGLYEVDFNDPKRTRTARTSAYFYGCLIKNRSLSGADYCLSKRKKERSKRTRTSNSAYGLKDCVLITLLLNFILSSSLNHYLL